MDLLGGLPAEVLAVLGEPPLMEGERREDYYTLLAEIGRGAGAADSVDWLLIENVCCCVRLIRYHRTARARLMQREYEEFQKHHFWQALKSGVLEKFESIYVGADRSQEMAHMAELYREVRRYSSLSHREELDELAGGVEFDRDKLTIDHRLAHAEAVLSATDKLRPIDRLIETLEARLEKVLQQIDRRHLVTAKLYEMAHTIIDAPALARDQLSPPVEGLESEGH